MGREVDHRLPESLSPSGSVVYSSKSQFPDNFIFLISGFCLPTTRSTRLMAVQYMLYPCALCMTWLSIFTCSVFTSFPYGPSQYGPCTCPYNSISGPITVEDVLPEFLTGHPSHIPIPFISQCYTPSLLSPSQESGLQFQNNPNSTILDTSTII